jgi:hypothetical protein
MRVSLGLLILFCGMIALPGCGPSSNQAQPTTTVIPERPSVSGEGGDGESSPAKPSMAPSE